MAATSDLFRYSPGIAGDHEDEFEGSEASNEETDVASEEDQSSKFDSSQRAYTEIKEQMYQDKLAELKRQLAQLEEGSHPDWAKKLRRLETTYRERLRINTVIRDLEIEMVEEDFINEKKSAVREFEDQKVYLRDHLITELEEKLKQIETERHNMELTGDTFEMKPISTRKLRRRANEPSAATGYGPGDKRRKPLQLSSMTYILDESDILDDLKIINKNKAFSQINKSSSSIGDRSSIRSSSPTIQTSLTSSSSSSAALLRDIKIVDGKLFFEKRWFRRGQAVQVEAKNGDRFPAMISAIGTEAIWVRKSNDSAKMRIFLTQLAKGKYHLKRRAV